MRKRDPNTCIDRLDSQINDLASSWSALCGLGKPQLAKGLAPQVAFSAAVGWETFCSEWHVAAVTRSPNEFAIYLTDLANKHLMNKYRITGIQAQVVPAHLTLAQVRAALDSKGENIAVGLPTEWASKGNAQLNSVYAQQLRNFTKAHDDIAEVLGAIRNFVGHRSTRARRALNDALSQCSDRRYVLSGARKLDADGLQAYLYANIQGARRLDHLLQDVTAMAGLLRF